MVFPRHPDIHLTIRYNEAVKLAMATRQAEVVEMYQPMTDAMRQCQEAITECMEAMLVELKRDHSLVSCPVTYVQNQAEPSEPRFGGYQCSKCSIQEFRYDCPDASEASLA